MTTFRMVLSYSTKYTVQISCRPSSNLRPSWGSRYIKRAKKMALSVLAGGADGLFSSP